MANGIQLANLYRARTRSLDRIIPTECARRRGDGAVVCASLYFARVRTNVLYSHSQLENLRTSRSAQALRVSLVEHDGATFAGCETETVPLICLSGRGGPNRIFINAAGHFTEGSELSRKRNRNWPATSIADFGCGWEMARWTFTMQLPEPPLLDDHIEGGSELRTRNARRCAMGRNLSPQFQRPVHCRARVVFRKGEPDVLLERTVMATWRGPRLLHDALDNSLPGRFDG